MRNIFKIFVIYMMISCSISAEFYPIRCDLPGSAGAMLFKDGERVIRQVSVGKSAESFNPILCQEGLFKGYFVPNADVVAEAGCVFLLVNKKLPAGFATIICSYKDENSFVTHLNFYAENDSVFIRFRDLSEELDDTDELQQNQVGYSFQSPDYLIEIWRRLSDQDLLIGRFHVQEKEAVLDVTAVEVMADPSQPSFLNRLRCAATETLERLDNFFTDLWEDDSGIEHLRPPQPFPSDDNRAD